MATSRIHEIVVPPALPEGRILAIFCGEAPGPKGADKTERPFWGDRAGMLVFRALHAARAFRTVTVAPSLHTGSLFPDLLGIERVTLGESFAECSVLFPWSGRRFAEQGMIPVIRDIMLTNAYSVCPTVNGETFRRPTKAQMTSPENLQRLEAEIALAQSRSEGRTVHVLAFGVVAAEVLGQHLGLAARDGVSFHALAHPSPQGILIWRNAFDPKPTVAQVQEHWIDTVVKILASAGVST